MIYYKRHGNANAEGTEDSMEHDGTLEFFCNADSCTGNNTHGIDDAFKKKKEMLTSRSWKATGVPSFKIFALNEDWKWSS